MKSKPMVVLLMSSVCIIWGTTWFAMKLAVISIPPIFATGLRFLCASPVLFVLARYLKQPLIFPKGKRHWIFIVAVMYFAIPFTLMISGEQFISSGIAAIIFANMPVAVMLTSGFLLGLRVERHQIFGLILAVVSLCMILAKEMDIGSDHFVLGSIIIVIALACHSLIYVLVQKYCKNINVITYNALPCLIASFLLFAVSWYIEDVDSHAFTNTSLLADVYLGLVASVGGILAYFKLGQISTPFQASICFLIFPIIAVLLSSVLNGESISTFSMLLMLPLLGGILLTKAPNNFMEISLFKKS